MDQFQDQFLCWKWGGMDVKQTMHSTLIRLPLRTRGMAESSALSKVCTLLTLQIVKVLRRSSSHSAGVALSQALRLHHQCLAS